MRTYADENTRGWEIDAIDRKRIWKKKKKKKKKKGFPLSSPP